MRKYGLIKLGLAAVMLTSASAASEGADVSGGPAYLPPAPPLPFVYNWTGFYAGAHGGVGWSDGDGGGSTGFIGGGQVGFNYQINQWVLGVATPSTHCQHQIQCGAGVKTAAEHRIVGASKVVTNERPYPYLVEIPVAPAGLDIALNRQIVQFHKSQRIQLRHGRTI